jgi:hypothetical protein
MVLTRRLLPVGRIEAGEERVPVDVHVHAGQVDGAGEGEGLRVDRRSADYEDGPVVSGESGEGVFPAGEAFRAFRFGIGERAAQDDVPSAFERTEFCRNRDPGPASHDHDAVCGDLGEISEVIRDAPGDASVCADDPVAGHGGDDFDGRDHMAISMRRAG